LVRFGVKKVEAGKGGFLLGGESKIGLTVFVVLAESLARLYFLDPFLTLLYNLTLCSYKLFLTLLVKKKKKKKGRYQNKTLLNTYYI
jgi:hypothetical protein